MASPQGHLQRDLHSAFISAKFSGWLTLEFQGWHIRTVFVGSMFMAWGCRPTPRRADARSTAFSPKSPRGLRPLSRLPGPGRGGGNGLFGPPSYPDRSADVVRLHRIFEYPTCLHTRISQFLLAFLLFATTSPRIGRHLPARKDVLIDGEAVAETLNAFGLLGANGGDLRQRRYPDRYAGVASASPHRPPGTAAGHFGEHLGPTDDQIA